MFMELTGVMMKRHYVVMIFFIIRICFWAGLQEMIFGPTVEFFMKTARRSDVMFCEFIHNGKIRFSSRGRGN